MPTAEDNWIIMNRYEFALFIQTQEGKKRCQSFEKIMGCDPKDISAYIGPGICSDHYEVSKDVADEFIEKYSWEGSFEVVTPIPGSDEKYLLDLHHACYINILRSGVPSEKIFLTDICTCCNPDLLFSHRFTGGRRGGLCGFMMKKDFVKHDNTDHIEESHIIDHIPALAEDKGGSHSHIDRQSPQHY